MNARKNAPRNEEENDMISRTQKSRILETFGLHSGSFLEILECKRVANLGMDFGSVFVFPERGAVASMPQVCPEYRIYGAKATWSGAL